MSRIGRMPINVEPGVKVAIQDREISVQGPKGSLSQRLPRGISAELAENRLVLHRKNDSKEQRSLHGMSRALLANAMAGVSQGFVKELQIHGVGYRAEVAGKMLKLTLGYTHPIEFPIPEGIAITVGRNNRLTVSGCDRQQVGQAAAEIRAFRPPDVYKQKGVRYADERLRKKAGKTAVK